MVMRKLVYAAARPAMTRDPACPRRLIEPILMGFGRKAPLRCLVLLMVAVGRGQSSRVGPDVNNPSRMVLLAERRLTGPDLEEFLDGVISTKLKAG